MNLQGTAKNIARHLLMLLIGILEVYTHIHPGMQSIINQLGCSTHVVYLTLMSTHVVYLTLMSRPKALNIYASASYSYDIEMFSLVR